MPLPAALPQAQQPSRPAVHELPQLRRAAALAKRSASSTGRSKKPSCSGMPPEQEFSRKSRWSSAAAAASAAKSRSQLARPRRARRRRGPRCGRAPRRLGRGAAQRSSAEMGMAAAIDLTSRDSIAAALRAHGAAVRRHRHPDQHGGDLSDADRRNAAEAVWANDAAGQRHQQSRAGRGSGADSDAQRLPAIDRPDQLGERGRAEAAAASRTT